MNLYIPARGDLVWLEFDPQAGHEQSGHRPAIVISHIEYNRKTGLALFCPITTKVKGYPFEVLINTKKVQGAILADQIRSLDWQARKARFIAKSAPSILNETLAKLQAVICS